MTKKKKTTLTTLLALTFFLVSACMVSISFAQPPMKTMKHLTPSKGALSAKIPTKNKTDIVAEKVYVYKTEKFGPPKYRGNGNDPTNRPGDKIYIKARFKNNSEVETGPFNTKLKIRYFNTRGQQETFELRKPVRTSIQPRTCHDVTYEFPIQYPPIYNFGDEFMIELTAIADPENIVKELDESKSNNEYFIILDVIDKPDLTARLTVSPYDRAINKKFNFVCEFLNIGSRGIKPADFIVALYCEGKKKKTFWFNHHFPAYSNSSVGFQHSWSTVGSRKCYCYVDDGQNVTNEISESNNKSNVVNVKVTLF